VARIKTAIFISGGGSNMASLIEAAKAPDYPADIVLVVANNPDAGGIAKAQAAGITTQIIDHRDHNNRESFDAALTKAAIAAECELICLAGFMRLLTDGFIKHWHNRLLNIHPALLPSFKGLNTHARALDAGVKFHGCTVHLVRTEMDTGPILIQAAVPVLANDTPESLAARVLTQEHLIYPRALAWVAGSTIPVTDDSLATLNQQAKSELCLINPPL